MRQLTLAALAVALAVALGVASLRREPPPRAEDTPSPLIAPLKARTPRRRSSIASSSPTSTHYLALNPIEATELGDHRFDDRFGDYASASWMADSLGIEQEALEKLAAVDPKQLSGEDLVTYEAFKQQRELNIGGYRYPSELLAINQFDNWRASSRSSGRARARIRSAHARLRQLPRAHGRVRRRGRSRRSTTCAPA